MIEKHFIPCFRARKTRWILTFACMLAFAAECFSAETHRFFEERIRPVLLEHCHECHGARAEKLKGGLRLDNLDSMLKGGDSGKPAIVPRSLEKSLLLEAIRHTNPKLQMPPRHRLSERQVSDFEEWIRQGAEFPGSESAAQNIYPVTIGAAGHWSFKPLTKPSLPSTARSNWVQSPVDSFILAKLEEQQLRTTRPADRRTLLRRATYDLTGLPPSRQEIDSFLADKSPDAFMRVVERLLASPAYGERWGRHWLDVVRYADARDLIQLPVESDFREAWRYRDWVIGAHNQDLPYPDFVRQQIAGDLLQPADPERMDAGALIATGMLALADFVPGDVDKDQMIADYVNDQVDVVGRAFLGLTLGCARCHDHKFDPVTIEDYYALAGIFFSSRLVPGPVPGNTPLVKIPLLPKAEVQRLEARKKRAAELEGRIQKLRDESDLEYLNQLEELALHKTADYINASWMLSKGSNSPDDEMVAEAAAAAHLHSKVLRQWIDYLGLRDYSPAKPAESLLKQKPEIRAWAFGSNAIPALHLNLGSSDWVTNNIRYQKAAIVLSASSSRMAVLRWTSPIDGEVVVRGTVSDAAGSAGAGFQAALDLRSQAGRQQLKAATAQGGGSMRLDSMQNQANLETIPVRKGDRVDFCLLPVNARPSYVTLDLSIHEKAGQRKWNAAIDLADRVQSAPGAEWKGAWQFFDATASERIAGEPALNNESLSEFRSAARNSLQIPDDQGAALKSAADRLTTRLAESRMPLISGVFRAGPETIPATRHPILLLRSEDPRIVTDTEGSVLRWPNRARSLAGDAVASTGSGSPTFTNVAIAGQTRAVLSFSGRGVLDIPIRAPESGTLFVVGQSQNPKSEGQRILGWEDSNSGRHGIGLMTSPGGGLHAILRKDGANGDIVAPGRTNSSLEVVCIAWGAEGTLLSRGGIVVGTNGSIPGISSDPEIKSLKIGGPGSGSAAKFQGIIAELRVYNRRLNETERKEIEQELLREWVDGSGMTERKPSVDWASLFLNELISQHSPFWLPDPADRATLVTSAIEPQIAEARRELANVKKEIPTNIPQAVVVLDGGPSGTRHEGFKDAHIYLRGNHKNPGKVAARGFPKFLENGPQAKIAEGSGRLALANWIGSTNNPLAARVAVNRIWQHHFGEGIVRTPTNFGERGERPTHPELLDYLATRFVESGWSTKTIHRLIMSSATYQQSSTSTEESARLDPENRLHGRMNRQRLDTEAIRDSLLTAAGRLDRTHGGPGFQEMQIPRRSLYMMSVRTGVKSGFASIFDAPDSGSVVEQRNTTTVPQQALFLMNDPFVREQADGVARQVRLETGGKGPEASIVAACQLIFGRRPTGPESEIGLSLLESGTRDSLERFCQLLLCANEFVYVD